MYRIVSHDGCGDVRRRRRMRRGDLRQKSINTGSDEYCVFHRCRTRDGLCAVA